MIIEDRIKELRERNNLSVEELSGKSGIDAALLTRAEDGDAGKLTIADIEKPAKIFQREPSHIMGWGE
ncbi:MAG: helix-turn-helix transcriptional regulator [Bacteroidales bacterium]|nr:helix-turn-helix transcriptional regulator [Bacteroidales bacterium]